MRVYPVPGRLVRDPATRHPLASSGAEVNPHDLHWARLLADGDVTGKAPDASARKASASAAKEG